MSHFFSDPDPEFQRAGVQGLQQLDRGGVREGGARPPDRPPPACRPSASRSRSREMDAASASGCAASGSTPCRASARPSGPGRPILGRGAGARRAGPLPRARHAPAAEAEAEGRPRRRSHGLATVGARDMIVDMAEIIQSGVHDRFPTLVWVAVRDGLRLDPHTCSSSSTTAGGGTALAARQAEAPAELLLPPQLARGLHDRPLRGDEPARDRHREHALVRPTTRTTAATGRRPAAWSDDNLPRRAGGRAAADVRPRTRRSSTSSRRVAGRRRQAAAAATLT